MLCSISPDFIRHMDVQQEVFAEALRSYFYYMKILRGSVTISMEELNGFIFGVIISAQSKRRSGSLADLTVTHTRFPSEPNKPKKE